jgi:hypothetical protein
MHTIPTICPCCQIAGFAPQGIDAGCIKGFFVPFDDAQGRLPQANPK